MPRDIHAEELPRRIFVRELMALEKKHGVYISACGCCRSPFLSDTAPSRDEELQYGNNVCDSELDELRMRIEKENPDAS